MLKKALLMVTCALIFSTASYADIEAGVICCTDDSEIVAISDKSGAIGAEGSEVIAKGKEKVSDSSEDTKTIDVHTGIHISQKCKSVNCKAVISQKTKGSLVTAVGDVSSSVAAKITETDE